MSEKKLLSCPFCGGEAEVCGYYFIQCTKCGASTLTHTNREKAVELWNTRVPMQKIVERLEEEAKQYNSLGDRAKEKGYCHEYASQCYGNALCYEDAIDIVKEEGGHCD